MNDDQGPVPGPEPLPEPGPVSVPAAAHALGISERAVRKRIHAGTLRAQPFGRSFMVWLPDDVPAAGLEPGPAPRPEPGPEPGPEPIEAAYRVTPAEIERAIVRTGQQYVTDMAALYDRVSIELGAVYEGQLAAKDQALAAKDETVAELRRRAEAAETAAARAEERASEPIPYTDYWIARALVEALERQRALGIQRADSLSPAQLRERGAALQAEAEAQAKAGQRRFKRPHHRALGRA